MNWVQSEPESLGVQAPRLGVPGVAVETLERLREIPDLGISSVFFFRGPPTFSLVFSFSEFF